MQKIIEILLKILDILTKSNKTKEEVKELPEVYRNKSILVNASKELGTLEWKSGSNPKVEKYLDHGARGDNRDSGLGDETPWCAGFVAYVLETAPGIIGSNPLENIGSTNSLMARSYEKWGKKVSDPLPGDIVTRYRKGKSSGFGHVGFFLGFTNTKKNHYYCLGGNQSDSVNITIYSMEQGSSSGHSQFRRSSKHVAIDNDMKTELLNLAARIRQGKAINIDQKVV